MYDLLVRLDTLRSDQLQSIILKNTSSNPVYIKPKNDSVIHITHLLSICVDRVPQYLGFLLDRVDGLVLLELII